jgi:hypothetical protein
MQEDAPHHQQHHHQQPQGEPLHAGTSSRARQQPLQHQQQQTPQQQDDDWWLASDSDDEQQQGASAGQAARSEDPLYDPDADKSDEAWAVQQRGGRRTDAILSCPGCFTTLCIDCQQHEHHHTQVGSVCGVWGA